MVTIWDMFYIFTITTPLFCAVSVGQPSSARGLLLGLAVGGVFATVDFFGMRVIVRRLGRGGPAFFGVFFLIILTAFSAMWLVHLLLPHRAA